MFPSLMRWIEGKGYPIPYSNQNSPLIYLLGTEILIEGKMQVATKTDPK